MVSEEERISTAIFGAPIPFQSKQEEQSCHDVLKSLSDEELELAACTSYTYFIARTTLSSFENYDRNVARTRMALRMVRRHLVAENGNVKLALKKLRETLKFRQEYKINDLRERFCTLQTDVSSHPMISSIAVCGYDNQNRAILVRIPVRFCSPSDESFLRVLLYQLERTIACTERKSIGRQEKIVVAIDYKNYEKGNIPPFHLLREFLSIFQNYYPERLHLTIAAVSLAVISLFVLIFLSSLTNICELLPGMIKCCLMRYL